MVFSKEPWLAGFWVVLSWFCIFFKIVITYQHKFSDLLGTIVMGSNNRPDYHLGFSALSYTLSYSYWLLDWLDQLWKVLTDGLIHLGQGFFFKENCDIKSLEIKRKRKILEFTLEKKIPKKIQNFGNFCQNKNHWLGQLLHWVNSGSVPHTLEGLSPCH